MFGGGKFSHSDSNGTLPGVFSKTGVVTFKKLDVSIITRQSVSRKRKAPDCPANKDKNDLSSSPNDALLQPDGDKVFYENLPFHGMQNPPNKIVQPVPVVTTTSRPSSELSHYAGSSGYGSTRSQTGAIKSALNQELNAQDGEHNFNSLKYPKKRPAADIPQFRSLRLSKRYRNPAYMHAIQETSEYQRPRVVGSEQKDSSDTMRKISPNCMLKSTILIRDAKKILTKDLKTITGDNVSDISGITELPGSEPMSIGCCIDNNELEVDKTEKSRDDFHNKDCTSIDGVIRTQHGNSQSMQYVVQNKIDSPTLKENNKVQLKPCNKNFLTKSIRDMKLRQSKPYRIIEMPKKDFDEFIEQRINITNVSENIGKCPNRISFDFINKYDPSNQLRILNCSVKNNSKSTSCLKDIEKLEKPKASLKTSISSENISREVKAFVTNNKAQVIVKPTIAKPARSFKNRPMGCHNTNQSMNTSNALRDMILKPPDNFGKTLSPSNSFNKDMKIRELDNSSNKTSIQAKMEPIKTESILEKNPMNFTAVLKSSVKCTNPKPSAVAQLKPDLISPKLVASRMRNINSNPVSSNSLKTLTQNDSKLLAASKTLDDIRKDLDNLRNRPSHRPSSSFNHKPNIKTEVTKKLEPVKIVTSESKDLNVSIDSNKYLKLISTPSKTVNTGPFENLQECKSRELLENVKEESETNNESSDDITESTQSPPETNLFKTAGFSTIESNRSDQPLSANFVIGSSTGALKSLSSLSLEKKTNQEDVYLNRCHIKPITRLKSSQSFQHRSTNDIVERTTPSMAKKPIRHSSLNNSFRALRTLMRIRSEDRTKSEDTTKPTPAPRRLHSFSDFKTRLTDSKFDNQNISILNPSKSTRKMDTDVNDPQDILNKTNKYASSRSLDRRYNGGSNHYSHHNGRTSSSTMHRNYTSNASRQDECILQAPSYQMPAPPPYLNHNGYSDLQMTHRPVHRPVLNPPYYQDYAAVIKFHDVGKEIDV